MQTKSLNNYFYNVELKDNDRPILFCIHGFPDNAHVWSRFLEEIGEDANYICPFAPGTRLGESFKRSDYSMNNYVNHCDYD